MPLARLHKCLPYRYLGCFAQFLVWKSLHRVVFYALLLVSEVLPLHIFRHRFADFYTYIAAKDAFRKSHILVICFDVFTIFYVLSLLLIPFWAPLSDTLVCKLRVKNQLDCFCVFLVVSTAGGVTNRSIPIELPAAAKKITQDWPSNCP